MHIFENCIFDLDSRNALSYMRLTEGRMKLQRLNYKTVLMENILMFP